MQDTRAILSERPELLLSIEIKKKITCFVVRTDDTDRVITTAIATALVDHAEVLLTHGARYYDI